MENRQREGTHDENQSRRVALEKGRAEENRAAYVQSQESGDLRMQRRRGWDGG